MATNLHKYPVCTCILDSRILKSLDKTLELSEYYGKGDPDEHVQLVDDLTSIVLRKWYVEVKGNEEGLKCWIFENGLLVIFSKLHLILFLG